jgi:hypothetical protein
VSVISDIATETLRRLEEDPANPIFWNLLDEVLPKIVEGMNELCLITGEPEIKRAALFTLAINTTLFTIPDGGIVLLRMEGPGAIRKTNTFELDATRRGWLGETGPLVKRWFPFGIGQFGIYPKLTAPQDVSLSFVQIPVTTGPTYTGAEAVPFREEFREGLIDYAEHGLRLKEGGQDFLDSMLAYDRFLERASELTKLGQRLGKLKFSRMAGAPAPVTDVVTK